MFVNVAELVQAPEHIVPSTVWCRGIDSLLSFFPNMLHSSIAQGWIRINAISDGIGDVPGVSGRAVETNTNKPIGEMVERASQIVQDITRENRKLRTRISKTLDIVNALIGLRIFLRLDDKWAGSHKPLDQRLQITNVMFGSFNFGLK